MGGNRRGGGRRAGGPARGAQAERLASDRAGPTRRRPAPRVPVALLALIPLTSVVAAPPWGDYARRPADWYRGEEGRRITANILSWQAQTGSWPKNGDTATRPGDGDRAKLKGTFDNGATREELRFLARAFAATRDARLKDAFLKGLDHILQAQYPTGGWPQSHPPGSQYHRHITFNDGTMVGVMEFLREVATAPAYAFVDAARRCAARDAFDRGVACIVKCQVVVNGRPTAWCAQHDEVTLEPRPARSYELVSLSGGESAGILRLLMSLEHPDPDVRRAIEAGAAWYESVKLAGIRVATENGEKVVVNDPKSPPVWARFYEIGTNTPIFSGRDGVKKYRFAEIEAERRNGYAWYGNWGAGVARDYAEWKKR